MDDGQPIRTAKMVTEDAQLAARCTPETALTPHTFAWELKHGCLATIAPDEPIFVLRAKDISAPAAVDFWINNARVMNVDPTKLDLAAHGATAMRNWRGDKKTPD